MHHACRLFPGNEGTEFYKKQTMELTKVPPLFSRPCADLSKLKVKFDFFLTLFCFSCTALLSSPQAARISQISVTPRTERQVSTGAVRAHAGRKLPRPPPADSPGRQRPHSCVRLSKGLVCKALPWTNPKSFNSRFSHMGIQSTMKGSFQISRKKWTLMLGCCGLNR